MSEASNAAAPDPRAAPAGGSGPLGAEALDREVLRLRGSGRAFAGISRDLGLRRPVDAQRAFRAAVRRLPADQQVVARAQEQDHLDRLAAQVRADETRPVEDRDRRLAVIDKLRGLLAEDPS